MTKEAMILSLLLFSFTVHIGAQEGREISIHQEHKLEFGAMDKDTNLEYHSSKTIIPLQKRATTELSEIVFGFLPYWEKTNQANNNIQYDLLSHLACFDFSVQLNAAITPPPGWPWTDEINKAHEHGTKVIMTVVNFGGNDGADAVAWELFTNSAKKNIFFSNIKSLIEESDLDGVNIDFEGISSSHRGEELNDFMLDLTNFIHAELPGKEVSFDGPAVNWGGWKLNDLVDNIDYLIIMAYNYNGSNSGYSGAVSPLIHPSSSWKSVTNTLENSYSEAITNYPEKIVLAVPYYGRHWTTNSSTPESSTISYIGSTRIRDTRTEATQKGGFIWSNDLEYPWYKWNDGTKWHQIWTDNEKSLGLKFDLTLNHNLAGIGIWALNYDGAHPELWDLIKTKFSYETATTSIEKNDIKVFPNPTRTYIELSYPKDQKITKIELYNLFGQSILNLDPSNTSLNVSQLKNGSYILNVTNEEGEKSIFKVLKVGE